MPSPEANGRHQEVTLWRKAGNDAAGRATIDSPEAVTVRWQEGRNELNNGDGSRIAYDASAKVPTLIPVDSIIWPYEFKELPVNKTPTSDLFIIIKRSVTPDLKARDEVKKVFLMRYTDSLPDIAT